MKRRKTQPRTIPPDVLRARQDTEALIALLDGMNELLAHLPPTHDLNVFRSRLTASRQTLERRLTRR